MVAAPCSECGTPGVGTMRCPRCHRPAQHRPDLILGAGGGRTPPSLRLISTFSATVDVSSVTLPSVTLNAGEQLLVLGATISSDQPQTCHFGPYPIFGASRAMSSLNDIDYVFARVFPAIFPSPPDPVANQQVVGDVTLQDFPAGLSSAIAVAAFGISNARLIDTAGRTGVYGPQAGYPFRYTGVSPGCTETGALYVIAHGEEADPAGAPISLTPASKLVLRLGSTADSQVVLNAITQFQSAGASIDVPIPSGQNVTHGGVVIPYQPL